MGDLIDRQVVIDAITNAADKWDCPDDYQRGIKAGIRIGTLISSIIPPAQPEIIRCRDCKHYYFADNRIPQEQRYVCDIDGEVWQPDDFCSYGERREEGK